MRQACDSSDSSPSASVPRISARTSSGSGPFSAVVDCFKAEPFGRFDDARREVAESLDTRDNEEPLGVPPWRCDVGYGPREAEVRRGRGEIGRLLG